MFNGATRSLSIGMLLVCVLAVPAHELMADGPLIPPMTMRDPLGFPPTAADPLAAPLFSIDLDSPTTGLGFMAADVLSAPGPAVEIPAANLCLSDEDDVDGLSFDNHTVANETFVLILSVDRLSEGGAPPDPNMVALGLPFNVQDQASKNQAAGDAYMSLLLFDRLGPVPPAPGPLLGSRGNNNTLVLNQGDAGGVQFSLLPDSPPTMPNRPSNPLDNANAGAGSGGASPDPSGPPEYIFFSLSGDSPSLPALPGATPSGADIFIDNDPNACGGELLYVDPFVLGLQPADDIDAFTVFDDGDHVFTPGIDQVVFSLTPDSPSLGSSHSPADLFTSEGSGVFDVYSEAFDLGLAFADNLNMLDFALCDDVLGCALDWGIGYVGRDLELPRRRGRGDIQAVAAP